MEVLEAEIAAIEHILDTLFLSKYKNCPIDVWSDSLHAIFILKRKFLMGYWINMQVSSSQTPRKHNCEADKPARDGPKRLSFVGGWI